MRAIQVTCPNCGARLRVNEGATTAACEYCNTSSEIQRRTGILQRVTLPPPAAHAVRYAVERRMKAWAVVVLASVLIPLVIVAVVTVGAVRAARTAFDAPAMKLAAELLRDEGERVLTAAGATIERPVHDPDVYWFLQAGTARMAAAARDGVVGIAARASRGEL